MKNAIGEQLLKLLPDIPSPLIDDGIFDGGDVNQIFNLFNTAQFAVHNHTAHYYIINHFLKKYLILK